MKFNFSLRGRQSADYTYVKASVPDVQEDIYRQVLAASLTGDLDPSRPLSEQGMAIRKELRNGDIELHTRLAIYLVEEKNFQSIAIWLIAELAAIKGNDERMAPLVERIVRQPLEIPLFLQYYSRAAAKGEGAVAGKESAAGRSAKPERAIRRQLAVLFNRLDEFHLSRCSRETLAALREALHLLRPKAADRQRKTLFSRLLRDQIAVRSTWEQEWHALHHQHYDSPEQRQVVLRDKWKEGISSFRIGYTALLDNLRPMLCAGVSGKVLKLAAEYLGNAAAVSRSGVSPLRLLEVYQTLHRMEQGGVGMLAEALEEAALNSSWATSAFASEGVSVIAMDVSNSMKRPVYPGGRVQRFDIAPLLAHLWKSKGYSVIAGILGNTWKPMELPLRPVLSATDSFRGREGEAGYALNAHLILQDLLRKNQPVERVLIFTDTRLWGNRTFNQPAGTDLGEWWRQYRRQVAPRATLYIFDLAGYGARTLEYAEDDVVLIAGWKDNLFDVLQA